MSSLHSEQAWLETIRAAMLRGDRPAAQVALGQALVEFPHSHPLHAAQAGLLQQAGRTREAAELYGKLLEARPDDTASAFALARILLDRARPAAAAAALRNCFDAMRESIDAELAIAAIELLDNAGRKRDAAATADAAIKSSPDDARLHAYAGMLAIQLGDFTGARDHYAIALASNDQAWNWHVPLGLASTQRYRDTSHADFTLFREGLQRQDLTDLARAELHFGLGKAYDDIGDYASATGHFRRGNAIRQRLSPWQRKPWRRTVEARLAAKAPPPSSEATPGFKPIFIVGMPRSGTTLLAQQLAKRPGVLNRGESRWLAELSVRPGLSGTVHRATLEEAATIYAQHLRGDDADHACWFIDKQPLNFRYLDLALGMFGDAKVVHCRRNARDTALSLWTQCFAEPIQDYSHDFGDIAVVMRDCERLMAHWLERYPDSIRSIDYETLVARPEETVSGLVEWLGLPAATAPIRSEGLPAAISTASLWQARQPMHTSSIGRSRHYLAHVPELVRFAAPDGAAG